MTYPSHRISSWANVCQTHAARHRSVAFRFLRICKANSGGNWDISEIFVTKMIDKNEEILWRRMFTLIMIVICRLGKLSIENLTHRQWFKSIFNRANIKPSRLATVTWTEDVDVERCAMCASDCNIFLLFFSICWKKNEW